MSETAKNNRNAERIDNQPLGSDYDQTLLEFLDREFSKPESFIRVAMGRFVPLFGLIKGLKVTSRAVFLKKYTVKYPEEKLEVSDVFRGRHVLLTSPSGEQICICCNACAIICPSDCITVRYEKSKDPNSEKRILTDYIVDLTRCMFCGLCQEYCPEYCLILGSDYEYSDTNRGVGLLNVHKDDIERRASEEQWSEIENLKQRKKTTEVKESSKQPETESVETDNESGEDVSE